MYSRPAESPRHQPRLAIRGALQRAGLRDEALPAVGLRVPGSALLAAAADGARCYIERSPPSAGPGDVSALYVTVRRVSAAGAERHEAAVGAAGTDGGDVGGQWGERGAAGVAELQRPARAGRVAAATRYTVLDAWV